MKKLLKEHQLSTVDEYYEMVIESRINGQSEQAKEQFMAMPKENRRECINTIGLLDTDTYKFFFNLL